MPVHLLPHGANCSDCEVVSGLRRRLVPDAIMITFLRSSKSRAHVLGFDLVKLEAEGAKREIRFNAGGWIAQSQVLVAEVHDRFVPRCSKQLNLAVRSFDGDYVTGENTVAFRTSRLPDAYIEHGYWAAASMHW